MDFLCSMLWTTVGHWESASAGDLKPAKTWSFWRSKRWKPRKHRDWRSMHWKPRKPWSFWWSLHRKEHWTTWDFLTCYAWKSGNSHHQGHEIGIENTRKCGSLRHWPTQNTIEHRMFSSRVHKTYRQCLLCTRTKQKRCLSRLECKTGLVQRMRLLISD